MCPCYDINMSNSLKIKNRNQKIYNSLLNLGVDLSLSQLMTKQELETMTELPSVLTMMCHDLSLKVSFRKQIELALESYTA